VLGLGVGEDGLQIEENATFAGVWSWRVSHTQPSVELLRGW
jgi:hypothetical protein